GVEFRLGRFRSQGGGGDGERARDGRPDGAAVSEASGARTVARKLALQALYRWQLNACPWQDLVQEFGDAEDMARADRDYFRALIEGVAGALDALDARLAALADRRPDLLDPIEHAILLLGVYELFRRPAVPYPLAIRRG